MINIKSIKPMNTKLLVTADRYTEDSTSSGVVLKTSGSIKEYQKVVAVGSMIREVEIGDLVMINPTAYIKKKYDNSIRDDMSANPIVSIDIPVVEIDKVPHFLIDIRDIDYVITDYSESENKIITPKSDIIL